MVATPTSDSRLPLSSGSDGSASRLVSVLVCTYNAEKFISQTIESLKAQTYRPLEIVVIDDGSSDGTWQILQSFGQEIRAFRKPNAGLAAARNACLREAKGDLLALMDHDDLCEPERIATQVALLEQHPEIGLCCSDFSAFDETGVLAQSYCGRYYGQCSSSRGGPKARFPHSGVLDISRCLISPPEQPTLTPFYYGRVYEQMVLGNFVHPPTVLFRRSILDAVGYFDFDLRSHCDWDWLVRASRMTDIAFIDRPLLAYRRSQTQISSASNVAQGSLDSYRVAQHIRERDPQLLTSAISGQVKRHLAEMCLDAADANVERTRTEALRLLMESVVRYQVIIPKTLRILVKSGIPSAGLALIRRIRGKLGAA